MRKKLAESLNERKIYLAQVADFGSKRGYRCDTIDTVLLVGLSDCEAGEIVAEHLWMVSGKQMEKLGLDIGDFIQFRARVTKYIKGYFGHRDDVHKPIETDYRLSNPTKFTRLALTDSAVMKWQVDYNSFKEEQQKEELRQRETWQAQLEIEKMMMRAAERQKAEYEAQERAAYEQWKESNQVLAQIVCEYANAAKPRYTFKRSSYSKPVIDIGEFLSIYPNYSEFREELKLALRVLRREVYGAYTQDSSGNWVRKEETTP